jgi:O-antigen/teichoic acid export membrane protein
MFRYGLPLSISSILSGFLAQFYNFLVVIYATDTMIGNYSVATNFVVLITFFATPITTMLFPAFSKLDPHKEREALQNVFQYSVKYAALIVAPVATAIMVLAQPAVSTLFGDKYTEAPLLLALLAINYLYVAFGSLSTGNLINSQGETRLNLRLALITTAIGFTLGVILIPRFGIIGLIATTLTAGLPSLIIALSWIRRSYSHRGLGLIRQNTRIINSSGHSNLCDPVSARLQQLDETDHRLSSLPIRVSPKHTADANY